MPRGMSSGWGTPLRDGSPVPCGRSCYAPRLLMRVPPDRTPPKPWRPRRPIRDVDPHLWTAAAVVLVTIVISAVISGLPSSDRRRTWRRSPTRQAQRRPGSFPSAACRSDRQSCIDVQAPPRSAVTPRASDASAVPRDVYAPSPGVPTGPGSLPVRPSRRHTAALATPYARARPSRRHGHTPVAADPAQTRRRGRWWK